MISCFGHKNKFYEQWIRSGVIITSWIEPYTLFRHARRETTYFEELSRKPPVLLCGTGAISVILLPIKRVKTKKVKLEINICFPC